MTTRLAKFVDPAEGWKYGFPAVWNEDEETLQELYDRHGYPEKLRKFPVRSWFDYVETDDE